MARNKSRIFVISRKKHKRVVLKFLNLLKTHYLFEQYCIMLGDGSNIGDEINRTSSRYKLNRRNDIYSTIANHDPNQMNHSVNVTEIN